MTLKCGIVGLPNVGKSTLFNALTQTISAQAANYPFCTIEPNVGIVAVPDERLNKLAKIAGSAKLIPNSLEFVDIAGLVKGANKGEGLGNQFLGHIREVDLILHVVRCFEDDDIIHVEGKVNPISDSEIIETELILADLDSAQKRLNSIEKKAKSNSDNKELQVEYNLLLKLIPILNSGKPAISVEIKSEEEARALKMLHLITAKNFMFVCNVAEKDLPHGNKYSDAVFKKAKDLGLSASIICSKIEEEISSLSSLEEKNEFLESLGLKQSGLDQIIKNSYQLLDLITFYTVGPKEAHAWTVKKKSTAPQAAGEIHSDFEKGFIRAETISASDFIQYNGEQGTKDNGRLRVEGKDYIVQDGDIFHFRFNV
ncbi:MAG: redox-regulated ATPase YchF [Alphaproteobacteria bacterium]|jgi:GTP-binding protein YchF